jgi:uncharacterized membrane protein YccC
MSQLAPEPRCLQLFCCLRSRTRPSVPSQARGAVFRCGFWARRNAAAFELWLRENWPVILHACRGGLTVMVLPLLLIWLAPLGSSTLAVTAVAVMAVPTTAILEPDARTVVQRAVYRLLGCVLGAVLGLFYLYWVGGDFAVWLLLLVSGVWLSSQIQSAAPGSAMSGRRPELRFF